MNTPSKITFDIVVSGCTAHCWHCYVDGGRSPSIGHSDYTRILRFAAELRTLAASQHVEVYPYLDLEPMWHADIGEMIKAFVATTGFSLPACMPTTGIPLAKRSDWEYVLAAYWEAGVRELMFTLHGPPDLHDRAVSKKGAYSCHVAALQKASKLRFGTRLNLMVSKPMLERFDETAALVEENHYGRKRAVIAGFVPNARLRRYERCRPVLGDLEPHADYFQSLCSSEENPADNWKHILESTEGHIYSQMMEHPERYNSYLQILDTLPVWRFLTVGPGLDIWYGNGLHRTKYLGNIGISTPEEMLQKAMAEYPNYSIGGSLPVGDLPSPFEVARAVADPEGQRIYFSHDELYARWLDEHLNRKSLDRNIVAVPAY